MGYGDWKKKPLEKATVVRNARECCPQKQVHVDPQEECVNKMRLISPDNYSQDLATKQLPKNDKTTHKEFQNTPWPFVQV